MKSASNFDSSQRTIDVRYWLSYIKSEYNIHTVYSLLSTKIFLGIDWAAAAAQES